MSLFLLLAGGLLVVIGGSILASTETFFESNGILIPKDPNLRSELRAPAGLLFMSGALVTATAIRRSLEALGLGLVALVYGTYGMSRLVSIAFDGWPAEGLVSAMVIELAVGAIALVTLLRSRAPTEPRERSIQA